MKFLKPTLCLLLFSGFIISSCNNEEPTPKDEKSFDKEKMDLYFDALAENDLAMGSLTLYENGKAVYKNSIGYADVEQGLQANTETFYRVGSITKTFTAAIVMQLVEENKISLDTALSVYFPEIPNADKITIGNLLRHRSGLYNFTDSDERETLKMYAMTRQELLDMFVANGAIFEPDERMEYCNTNYVLLTFILEDIEGKAYQDILTERILSPYSLTETYYGDTIDTENGEANSYTYNNASWIEQEETHMSIPRGAGAIVSTPTGLCDFYEALFKGDVVSSASLTEMLRLEDNWGIGMTVFPFVTFRGYGHGGAIDGFMSVAIYFPSKDLTIAYTSNGVNMSLNDVVVGVLSIYFGIDYELPE